MSKEHAYAYEAGYIDGSTHYELEHCPACKNVADLQEALDENAKLRDELDAAKHDLSVFSGRIVELAAEKAKLREDMEDLEGYDQMLRDRLRQETELQVKAEAENAKLRELVRAAWRCIHTGASCSDCRLIAGGCTLQTAMRELGVEVDA